jgi:nitroreductase
MTTHQQNFDVLKNIIETRRTVKPESMNGRVIPEEQMEQIIALADWAPTHGRTEPWRFFLYTGTSLKEFGQVHADLYKANTPEENFNPATFDNLLHKVDLASHLVIAVMKRGANPKIPAFEEMASASASVEHMLLGANALGIATMWNTGGMAQKPALKAYLGLEEEDVILGLIYLGYTDEPAKEGKRTTPLSEKVIRK